MPRAQSDDRTSSGSSPISTRPSEVMTKTELMLRSHAGPLSDRDLAKASQADLASGPRLEVPRRGHPGENESLAAPREATTRGMSYRAGPQCATCIEVPPTECCRRDRESKLLTSEAARTGWGGQVASCRTTSPPSWPAPPRGRACRTYTGDRGAILNPISERARDGRTPSRGRAKAHRTATPPAGGVRLHHQQRRCDRRRDDGADKHRPCIISLAHRGSANLRGRGTSGDRRAVMAEAHDLVQLAFADVEKCNGIAHRVAGQAFGVQARIAERQPARRGEAKLCCRTRGRTLPAAERPGGSSNVRSAATVGNEFWPRTGRWPTVRQRPDKFRGETAGDV